MRKSTFFLSFLAVSIALFALIFAHASYSARAESGILKEKGETVKKLQLTDLCLFTEANYTRHLSQADMNTPFQDHPMSFEHFPSGSLVPHPFHKKSVVYEAVD
jgi:hypothetical protein